VRIGRAAQHAQPLLAETLEGVRRAARLERAAAQDLRPRPLDGRGNGVHLLIRLRRAGAGHDDHLVAPYSHVVDVDEVSSGLKVRLARLVRLRDAEQPRGRRRGCQSARGRSWWAPDDAQHGSRHPRRTVNVHPQLDEARDHGIDLRLGGALVHYDDHVITLQSKDRSLQVGTRLAFGTARFVDDAFEIRTTASQVSGPARSCADCRTFSSTFFSDPLIHRHAELALHLPISTAHATRTFSRRTSWLSMRRSDPSTRRCSGLQPTHILLYAGVESRDDPRGQSRQRARCPRRPHRPTARPRARDRASRCRTERDGQVADSPDTSTISRAPVASASRAPVTPSARSRTGSRCRAPRPCATCRPVVVGLRSQDCINPPPGEHGPELVRTSIGSRGRAPRRRRLRAHGRRTARRRDGESGSHS